MTREELLSSGTCASGVAVTVGLRRPRSLAAWSAVVCGWRRPLVSLAPELRAFAALCPDFVKLQTVRVTRTGPGWRRCCGGSLCIRCPSTGPMKLLVVINNR